MTTHSDIDSWRAIKCTLCNVHFLVEFKMKKENLSCPHCLTPWVGGKLIETGGVFS